MPVMDIIFSIAYIRKKIIRHFLKTTIHYLKVHTYFSPTIFFLIV